MAHCSEGGSGMIALVPLLVLVILLSATPVHCFGAGNIPSYAYLEGKAFRHGDLCDTLEELAKGGGGAAGILGAVTGGLLTKKFGGLDIKRVYFGNWLRDYSQAMDVAGLSKLSRQAILNLCMVLGFLAHGYATGEFEVTEDRLGVYLPTEHIDNPKDYNENKDARTVHPKLRPPVDPQELEVDPRSGMLNYIANENGHWSTSKAVVRATLLQCIDFGRRARNGGGHDALYESYRLLGQGLHTLEDFPAHSNYVELVLLKLGYGQVFCHVGDNVRVHSPNGQAVPPLVTGTFGGSDFIHSLLGEATDHISSASVSDLNKELERARSQPQDRGADSLRDMIFQLPGSGGQSLSRDLDGINNLRAGGGKDPMNMSPQELHAVLWQVLSFRDNVAKYIERTMEKIPGLNALTEKIGNSIATFVFVTLEPYLKPIMQQATGVLSQGSSQVVNSQDQFRVFNDPNYAHPTHSLLAKDHFNGILNEPAGNVAKVIVKHVVKTVVKAWDETSSDPHRAVEDLLQVLYHPHFGGNQPVQSEMEQTVRRWMDSEDKNYTLNALTKDAVRAHKNHRKGHATEEPTQGPGGYTSFLPTPQHLQSQASGYINQQLHQVPGYNQFHSVFPGSSGVRREVGANDDLRYDDSSDPPAASHSPYPGAASHSSYQQPEPQQFQGNYGASQGYGDPQAYDSRANEQPFPGYQPQPQGGYDQFGGPPQQHFGHAQQHFGGPPPPPPQGWGMPGPGGPPPPGGFGGYSNPNAYPGQEYQQGSGQGWSNQPPPPGRW